MKKDPVILTSLLSIILVVLTSPSFAQGIFDNTFGSNGARSTPIGPTEQLVGAERQALAARQDTIIVATTSPGNYIIRRFNKNAGNLSGPPFLGGGMVTSSVGGNATAGAMTIGTSDEIYVAGTGSAANTCTVVKYQPTGSSPVIRNLTLPAPYSQCTISSAKVNGGKLYVWGTVRNTITNRLAFVLLRLTLPAFVFDPAWGAGGFVVTPITWAQNPTITISKSLAFDTTRVYGSGWLNAPGPLSGTAIVGYNMSGPNTGQVATTFGNRSTASSSSGNGVYLISGMAAGDMVNVTGNLYLNGNVPGASAGNMGLVRLNLSATGSDVSYPAADLLGHDNGLRLAKDNSNRLISGGRSDILPTNLIDIGLAKYNAGSLSLTNTWMPPQLRVLRVGFPMTTPLPMQNRDLRRISPGPGLELLLNSLVIQSTNNIIVVAYLYSGGTGHIWLGRIRN